MSILHSIYSNNSSDINDEIISSIFYPNNKKSNSRFRLSFIKKNNLYDYLINRYDDYDSISEIIYRIHYKIEIRPVCAVCGKRLKFTQFNHYKEDLHYHCCNSCAQKDPLIRNKIKNTCEEKYGASSMFSSNYFKEKTKETCIKIYGKEYYSQTDDVMEKVKNTCIKRYGVSNPAKAESVKEKIKQTCLEHFGVEYNLAAPEIREKIKNTCIEKYGVEYSSQAEIMKCHSKETSLKRYGCENPGQGSKAYETRRKNNSFTHSKPEDEAYTLLKSKYDLIYRQYKSNLYPFPADFYIPELDLYIEYQGTWMHGGHPYDPLNEDDIKIVNKWKLLSTGKGQYEKAIKGWTVNDPTKRRIAKENNLNFIEFWNLNEVREWINNKEKE